MSSELGKPIDREGQDAKGEGTKEASEKSIFVNSEPMREEQVQNAVKFLSHPKVRGSPVIYRRSFLEKKGLTKEEIDEAFRRVPVRKAFFFLMTTFYAWALSGVGPAGVPSLIFIWDAKNVPDWNNLTLHEGLTYEPRGDKLMVKKKNAVIFLLFLLLVK